MRTDRYAKLCWLVLGYAVLVILWGAYVRATGSGAGCGSHWPTCNGEIIPRSAQAETLIEFTHRLTSGLLGLLIAALIVGAYRRFPKAHRVRKGAVLAGLLTAAEALIGAGIVRFEWVADNDSLGRVLTVGFHLGNTFLLLAALTLTAWWAGGGARLQFKGRGATGTILAGAVLGTMLVGGMGAVTALGDTLALHSGVSAEESPMVAALTALRFVHPMLALLVALPMMALPRVCGENHRGRIFAILTLGTFHFQLLVGAVNVILAAPVWLQMVHLLLADALWIFLVLTAAAALAAQPEPSQDPMALSAAA